MFRRALSVALGAGLVVLTSAGCALLGEPDWSCSDEATPKYQQLTALVKQWSQKSDLEVDLVADCGQSKGLRFLEVAMPPQPLLRKLSEVCQQDMTCSSDGLSFTVTQTKADPDKGTKDTLGFVLTR